MKVSEIAKTVGKENADVAKDLGIETTQGYWLRDVDDAKVADYLAENGARPSDAKKAEQVVAKFWCTGRSNRIEGDEHTKHDTIQFVEWSHECDGKSAEAELSRKDYAWARFGVAEVIQRPYEDAGKRADFIRFIEALMFTGPTQQDGASRKGHKSALALLTEEQAREIPKNVKNRPLALARAIAEQVSLSVDLS